MAMMDPNLQIKNNPGCKEIILRKLSCAVVSSVLSQLLILCLFLFVTSFNVLDPVQWMRQTFYTLTSISSWLFVPPFLSIIFAQSMICGKDYVLQTTHSSSRIQKFLEIFSLRNLTLLVLHVLIGGVTVWLFLSLSGSSYNSLYVKCKSGKNCLVEETFFLLLCGLWIGTYFFLRVCSANSISFPIIQQPKLLQFKTRLLPLIKESQKASFLPTFYYFVFYILLGKELRNVFIILFDLEEQVDSSVGLFIYIYSLFFTALYVFNMNLMRFFFELFLTESLQFPIASVAQNDLTLTEAISINTIPIMQQLAALDLYELSHNSKARRELLFTLSQPGNHPIIWNNLIEQTLKIITQYTDMLNKSANDILCPEQAKKVEISTPMQNPVVNSYYYRNMRNMSIQNMTMPLDVVTVSHNKDLSIVSKSLVQKLKEKLGSIFSMLRTKLGINYLFGQQPILNIESCLSNGQVILWLTQAVSSLVVASFNEDKFGIVQKDVPVILSSLIDLKHGVERLNKIPYFTRKGLVIDDFNVRMKVAVYSAIKRSLYNICREFGPYLNDFTLNKEILQLFHNFSSNKNV